MKKTPTADDFYYAQIGLTRCEDDSELYVRRSVANHLGDMAKDHPDFAFDVCDRWLNEVDTKSLSTDQKKNRYWLIRHAVRHPAKHGIERALHLRVHAQM